MCVNALSQGRHTTLTVAGIALADVLQKGGESSIETFLYQLFIAAASTLLGRRGEKYFKHGIREYDRSHITTFRYQTRNPAKRLLTAHKSLTH